MLTVLGHRPAGYFDILVLEQLDDPLIGVRILRTLRADDLLDLELDRLGRQILAVGASNPRVEKVLELVDALRGMDVLVRGDAGYSGFVHSDVLGDVPQDERLQVRGPLVEKLPLKLQDGFGDPDDGPLPLLYRPDQPLSAP